MELKWDKETKASQILFQMLEFEETKNPKNMNTIHGLAFTLGKITAMEHLYEKGELKR